MGCSSTKCSGQGSQGQMGQHVVQGCARLCKVVQGCVCRSPQIGKLEYVDFMELVGFASLTTILSVSCFLFLQWHLHTF